MGSNFKRWLKSTKCSTKYLNSPALISPGTANLFLGIRKGRKCLEWQKCSSFKLGFAQMGCSVSKCRHGSLQAAAAESMQIFRLRKFEAQALVSIRVVHVCVRHPQLTVTRVGPMLLLMIFGAGRAGLWATKKSTKCKYMFSAI